jgi:hypothetical protein
VNRSLLLVRQILERASVYEWSLQGFGMFRLYLSKATRLHVWDSRFAVPNVTTIHTHPWDFKSTVLCGEITDCTYDVVMPTSDKSPTHCKQSIVCGPGGGMTPDSPEEVRLIAVKQKRIKAEDSGGNGRYTLRANEVHDSVYTDGTITIIDRVFLPDTEHALVFYPFGQKWVSAEPRAATQHEVKAMAEVALSRIKQEFGP